MQNKKSAEQFLRCGSLWCIQNTKHV